MKIIQFIFTSVLLISLSNCKKKVLPNSNMKIPVSTISGTLKNLTGLDGCGWVIELDVKDKQCSKYIEPVNLEHFNLNLVDGQKVKFNYIGKKDRGSICMVGIIVELTSIKTAN